MPWEVILVDEVDDWFADLAKEDVDSAELVTAAIDMLEEHGPTLSRPLADRVKGSSRHSMKELRPGSAGSSEIRILYIFDPQRRAILLVASDKEGQWREWYRQNIPMAERRYERWLAGDYDEERK